MPKTVYSPVQASSRELAASSTMACVTSKSRSKGRGVNRDRSIPSRRYQQRWGFSPVELPAKRDANRAAFTLIELLVVIGVIALLIGILMPVLRRARAQANRAVCLSNIRQLGVGILMYCNDNRGYFPTCAYSADNLSYIYYPDDWVHWQANRDLDESAIARYVGRGEKLKSVLRCRADAFDGRKTRPGSPGQGPYLYSYNMNDNAGRNFKPYGAYGRSKISWWRPASMKMLLTEGSEKWLFHPVVGYASPLTQRHGSSVFHGNVPGNPLSYGTTHGSNVSTVFMDGHAESIDQDFAFNRSLFEPEGR
jgi:prepilin-type N-terminal cleavage/methylation domain-containing protein